MSSLGSLGGSSSTTNSNTNPYTGLQNLSNFSQTQVSTANATATPTISGLASGLDTATIISQLMAVERAPETKLQWQVAAQTQRASELQEVQSQLQTLQSTEQALQSPGLWAPTQSVGVSDPTKVGATLSSAAAPGGYQVDVTHLALSWQHTYGYTAPAADSTITIGGTNVTIAAGDDINAAAQAINSTAGIPVYAVAVTDPTSGNQNLVLSSRQTGQANNFAVSASGLLNEDTTKAVQGADAQFAINGTAASSASNTVTNAIPGVTLSLNALTTTSGSVTVNVGTPAPNQTAITAAVKAFTDQYNTTVTDIQSKLNELPVASPKNASDYSQGQLHNDAGLTSLLDSLRQQFSAISSPNNPSGYQQLSVVGLSTGAAVGSGGLNQNAILGKITFDTTTFQAALTANPTAMQTLFGGATGTPGFAQAFDAILAPEAGPGGVLDNDIASANQSKSTINSQIADMEQRLTLKQQALQTQFTNMETALSASQSQSQWLTGEINSLP